MWPVAAVSSSTNLDLILPNESVDLVCNRCHRNIEWTNKWVDGWADEFYYLYFLPSLLFYLLLWKCIVLERENKLKGWMKSIEIFLELQFFNLPPLDKVQIHQSSTLWPMQLRNPAPAAARWDVTLSVGSFLTILFKIAAHPFLPPPNHWLFLLTFSALFFTIAFTTLWYIIHLLVGLSGQSGDLYLHYLLMNPQYLVCNRCSTTICGMNKWMND